MAVQPPRVDRWIRDNTYSSRYPFWTRANVAEVLPEPPSPLGWDLVWEGAAVAGWRDLFVDRLGMLDAELDPDRSEQIGIFGGYAYLGASLFRVWAGRTPGMTPTTIDELYFTDHPDVPPYVAEDWHANAHTTEVMTRYMAWATTDRSNDDLERDRLESRRVVAERPDLDALSENELLERARSLRPLFRRMFHQHINQSIAASFGPGILGALCAAIGRPEVVMHLLAGLGGVDSAAPSFAMWELSRQARQSPGVAAIFDEGPAGLDARLRKSGDGEVAAFVSAFDAFLAEFGSRGPNEWDIAARPWELNPDLALVAIDRMRAAPDGASPMVEHESREAERSKLGAEVRAALGEDAESVVLFDIGMANAETFIPGRERSKTSIIRVIHEARLAIEELGNRFAARGVVEDPSHIYLLFLDEIEQLVDGEGGEHQLAGRAAYREWLRTLEPPYIINGQAPPNEAWPLKGAGATEPLAVGDELAGVSGCPGKARGFARVILDPADPTALRPGDVLVAPLTDPSWTPLFVPAVAVVVDTGAMLSHAVIVSRELGIPCVPSVLHATRRIPDGALLEVDGDRGVVTVLSLP